MATRVAFFDNQPIRLKGLALELERCFDVEIVGIGCTLLQFQDFASSSRNADCVVVIFGGLVDEDTSVIRQCVQRAGQSKIVVMASSAKVGYAVKVLEAGAAGYILSTSTAEQLIDAIKCVAKNEVFITRSLAMPVINAMRRASSPARKPSVPNLTAREEQILQMLLYGKTNKEIAHRLLIREKTVKHYMTGLMQKMNARNRTEVVLAAHVDTTDLM